MTSKFTNGIDIKKAVIDTLKTNFEYTVRENEVIDNFDKPSFFVYNPYFHTESTTVNTNLKTYQIEIQFHHAKNNKLIEMQEELYFLFDYIFKCNNRSFLIQNTDSDIIENNLYFTFDIRFTENKPNKIPAQYEKMQELNVIYKEESK